MSKTEKLFRQMVDENHDLFDKFIELSEFGETRQKTEEFHSLGEKILEIISIYEEKLCGDSDRAGKSRFTSSLSEGFWQLIREKFPEVDDVGVLVV